MKQLKRISLKEQELLSTEEMKLVRGGDDVSTGCENKSKDTCSGDCLGEGIYPGSCGWSGGSFNRCTCAFIVVEDFKEV